MYPKLHTSLHFQYHIGGWIIISLVVLSLGWSRGRHIDSRLKERDADRMSNVSVSAHSVVKESNLVVEETVALDTGTFEFLNKVALLETAVAFLAEQSASMTLLPAIPTIPA
jgi:hypothetical protein